MCPQLKNQILQKKRNKMKIQPSLMNVNLTKTTKYHTDITDMNSF